MAVCHTSRRLCRFRVDVIGLQENVNFSRYEVEARDAQEAMAKVTAATGARKLKAHEITRGALWKGYTRFLAEQLGLLLNW